MIEKRQPIILEGRFATIPLSRGLFAIVDEHRFKEVNRYRWRLVRSNYCIYAGRRVRKNGHEKLILLHRFIKNTPPGIDCHHKNRYTLDCRECNLENKLPRLHQAEHAHSR